MSTRAAALILLLAIIPAYAVQKTPPKTKAAQAAAELDSAARDMFTRSDIASSRVHTEKALALRPRDLDASFVLMEAAMLQADTASELSVALRLCDSGSPTGDPRVEVASAHILDLAANTDQFRPAIARIQAILRNRRACENNLRAALIAAAMDGAPGLSPTQLAHDSGLLTAWRIAGPFGQYLNVDFDTRWAPENDRLLSSTSGGKPVEQINYLDGRFQLPGYFNREGVYYAAAEFKPPHRGQRIVRVESPGTFQLWIDGVLILTKDDRFRATPEVVASAVRLSAGKHQLLVKFISTALPFRVAILPRRSENRRRHSVTGRSDILAFANAENSYWKGDYTQAIPELEKLRHQHSSASVDFLLAQAWRQQEQNSDKQEQFLSSAEQSSPDSGRLRYELANRAYNAGHLEEAIAGLRSALETSPEYIPALELAARISSENHWTVEADNAFASLAHLHPSCANLHRAHDFYVSQYELPRARAIESQLDACAAQSLDLAQVLSAAGDHPAAATAAAKVTADYPLDRDARSMLVRELSLAGNHSAARAAAEQLALIAPNSATDAYSRESLTGAPPDAFADAAPFYWRFRHDGVAIAKNPALAAASSDLAVRLLDQRLAHLEPDGSFSIYVHRVTRILNRAAIQQYGEVVLPPGASLLELRTVQADGTISEPELESNKSSVSMPALVPGSTIDVEYVRHLDAKSIRRNPDDFTFTFGSFQMPVLHSEFGFLAPAKNGLAHPLLMPGAPQPIVSDDGTEQIEIWRLHNLPRAKQESNLPPNGGLPKVVLVSSPAPDWRGIQSVYRNLLIDAIRIGPQVENTASAFDQNSEQERARSIYHFVLDKLNNDGGSLATDDLASAEDTLSDNSGSPTTALISLARARGLQADLVLARGIASPLAAVPSLSAYDRPLVQITLHCSPRVSRTVLVDVEDGNLPFGALPPDLYLADALLVPAQAVDSNLPSIIALHPERNNFATSAQGDSTVDEAGDLHGVVQIQFSDWRSAELRTGSSGTNPQTQLLMHIAQTLFKDATDIIGSVKNLDDPDQPLSARIIFRVPHFWNLGSQQSPDVAQLAPAIGLKTRYTGSTKRVFPLYVDEPVIETSTFRVHLPAEVAVKNVPATTDVVTQFGTFRMEVRETEDGIEIDRRVSTAVQVIPPDRLSDFTEFADQIDRAEHARLALLPAGLNAGNRH
jgi:tetratricopeptide (TPR) repeat protein